MTATIRRFGVVLAFVAMATCASIDNIDVDASGQGTIPRATALDRILSGFEIPGFDSVDFSQSFKNQGVSKDDVDSVRVKTFNLRIQAPEGQTFDFMESVAFFAEASGQQTVRIAHLDQVPRGVSQLSVPVDPGVELKPFVVAPQMSIRTEASGSRPEQDTTVSANVVLDVDIHTGCE